MVAVPAFGAAKQYVLTLFERPVIVNGQAYKDTSQPILNHNGRTYVPLAKVGELTGVPVVWNEQLKQVEIGGKAPVSERDINPGSGDSSDTDGPAGRKNDNLQPDTEIIREEEPGYKGYPDSADITYQMAVEEGRAELPPLLSEGWISKGMLEEIENIAIPMREKPDEIQLVKVTIPVVYLATLKLPENFDTTKNGSFVIDGIRIIKYDGNTYFNISDLKNKNIISN